MNGMVLSPTSKLSLNNWNKDTSFTLVRISPGPSPTKNCAEKKTHPTTSEDGNEKKEDQTNALNRFKGEIGLALVGNALAAGTNVVHAESRSWRRSDPVASDHATGDHIVMRSSVHGDAPLESHSLAAERTG